MKICVFGAASNAIDKSYITATEKLGQELAKRGHTLVFGAGGNGLMGAVARGVKSAGGKVIGVIPKFFKEDSIEKIFEECDELIFTETMAERKSTMENLSDAFVIYVVISRRYCPKDSSNAAKFLSYDFFFNFFNISGILSKTCETPFNIGSLHIFISFWFIIPYDMLFGQAIYNFKHKKGTGEPVPFISFNLYL